jgi:hypothetical protein
MLRSALTLLVMCATLLAQRQSKPVQPADDMSKMPPEAHAPLFQAPKAVDAGALTDRVVTGLPAPVAGPPERNPQGPSEGMYRVVRGGSWFDQAGSLMFLTCSYRSWTRPGERSETIGFRCAKSLAAAASARK